MRGQQGKRRRGGSKQGKRRHGGSLIGEKSELYVGYNHCGSSKQLYSVYALDFSNLCDDGEIVKPLPKPVFSFDAVHYPDGMSFASLGSKIYLLGGRYPGFKDVRGKLSSNVYVYDTKENFLKKGPPMNSGKFTPIVVTICNKIYVISSLGVTDEQEPRVEVFDPNDDSWTALPDPALFSHNFVGFDYEIEAHTVHGSTIFFSTKRKGVFCLDVTKPHAWQQVELLGDVQKLPFLGGAQFIDGIWYAAGNNTIQAYDITTAGTNGFVRELKLLDVEPKFKSLDFFVDCRVVDLGDGKLGLIRSGLDHYPYDEYQCEGRLYITLDVFQVANRLCDHHSLSFTRLYSSTYSMDDNPSVWGLLGGCFLM